jgi:hypothetical protein
MVLPNTVLKLNLKGRGESLVWHRPTPIIDDRQVDAFFPQTVSDLYGPNVGLSSARISRDLLFLTTTSTWNLKDEYGRKGIALSQGILINSDPSEPSSLGDICGSFEVLLKIHRVRYETLSEVLEYLATQGNVSDAQKLVVEISHSFDQVKGECDSDLITSLVMHLESNLGRSTKKLRVDVSFPWSEDLGFFSLLGLQIISENIRSIGGGKLVTFDGYQHISTAQAIPGFEYVDLNGHLASLAPRVDIASSMQDKGGLRLQISKLRIYLSAVNTPLVLAVVVLCVGAYLMYQQRQILNKLDMVVGEPKQVSKSATPVSNKPSSLPTNTSTAPAEQEDSVLRQTIAQLYDVDKNVRLGAIGKLVRDKSSHEKLVPIAIKYALDHPTDQNGLVNTFLVFQKCDPKILKSNRDGINSFLELLSKSNPNAPGANRMKVLVSEP